MIRGRICNCNLLQNWKLEGMKASNNEWIELDKHSNDRFNVLQVRIFSVTCSEKLKSVRLTQTGPETSGSHWLCINAFDVFGILFDQK